MDARIKARFYEVENVKSSDSALYECLDRLWNHPEKESYVEIFGGVKVRLERYESDHRSNGSGFVSGEFVRQQTDNIPPIAEQGQPLSANSYPLGHRCAFRYHPRTSVILLESRRGAVTPIRIDGLIKARLSPHKGLFLSPVLSEGALENLRNGTPRNITFRVARPAQMDRIEGDLIDLDGDLARLATNFNGLSVGVSIGFPKGENDRSLDMNMIDRAIKWASGNRNHVESMKVKVMEEPDSIDVFTEQLKVVKDLQLDSDDVQLNYETRRAFLAASFDDYMPVLERIYQS